MKTNYLVITVFICSILALSFQNSRAQTVTTLDPTEITSTSAVLHGIVNPNNKVGGTASFISAFGTIQTVPSTLTGNIDIPVSADVTNLTPNTEYTYYLEYVNTVGGFSSWVEGNEVTFNTFSTSINNCSKLSEIKIFPNPATNVFYINSNIKIQRVEICNLLGKIIQSEDINQNSSCEINITGFTSGMYLVKVNAGNESLIRPLVVR